ncbi:hypothetical protein Vafri_8696 [Volvox africanus]|uniref:Aminotransferase class I/classII large domain-containing protein n=1 Tax=Volvox africanus TaxID=51714 RepID=A0A8J4B2T9_9CHLO|nr:hypothetical protein Vafri_8696 [Volvox africanus]
MPSGLVHRFAGVDGVISLAAGLPPAEAFPVTELTARTVDGQDVTLGSEGRQAYLAQQYNFNPKGYDPLLKWLRNLTVELHGVQVANAPAQGPVVVKKKEPGTAAGGPGGDTAAAVALTVAAAATPPPPPPPAEAEAVTASGAGGTGGATAAAPAGPTDAESAAVAVAVAVAATTQASPEAPVRDLVLTSGAIHAIFAIISCLTDPGDTIVVDEYTYTHALECVFLPRGLRLLPIRGDREGLDAEDLDRQLQLATAEAAAGRGACRRPRLLYTIPTGHNPTGAVMGEQRKRRILEVCEAHDLLILEDDAYYWLYYPYGGESGDNPGDVERGEAEAEAEVEKGELEGRGGSIALARGGIRVPGLEGLPPSLLHLDTCGRVIRVDTFSKLLGPGYRLGWITAPSPLAAKLANWVQASTVGPCSVTQVLVAKLLQQWGMDGFKAYVRKLQGLYASRAAMAHAAVSAHLGDLAEWQAPHAGMFMWIQIPGDLDEGALLDALVAAKVVVVPGSMFATRGLQATLGWAAAPTQPTQPQQHQQQQLEEGTRQESVETGPRGPCCLRLSFAGCPPEDFREGVVRLANVIRAALLSRGAQERG